MILIIVKLTKVKKWQVEHIVESFSKTMTFSRSTFLEDKYKLQPLK